MPHIKVDNTSIGEIDGFATLRFTLSEPSAQTVSFHYNYGEGSGSSYNDFPPFSGDISFAPGETSASVRVAIYNDTKVESTESFFINLSAPVNATLERTSAAITLIDNDATPGVPNISVTDTVVDEKSGFAYFVVTLDRPSAADVSVSYANRDGSATNGADYVAQSGTLVFHAGETAKTVAVPLIDDTLAEAQEAFSLILANASGGVLANAVATARIGISDSASAAVPHIFVSGTTIGEADGYADVVFSLSAPSQLAVSVSYGYDQAAASSYSDFPPFSGTVSFAPGETSKTVRIATYEDTRVEAPEVLRVTLSTPVNGTLAQSSADITIIDNDAPAGIPSISIGSLVVDEAAGVARFVVSLDKPAGGTVSVGFATTDGSALAGSSGDYLAQSGTLAFRPGETSKTISVMLNNDSSAEAMESFRVQLDHAVGGTIADGSGVAIIAASDMPVAALPQIRVGNTTMGEADGFVDVVLTLSAPSQQAVSVSYGYDQGAASSYSDFPPFSGTVSFAPGETSKTVRVATYEDTRAEAPEVMYITLSSAVNATLERTSATITLIDNDAPAGTPTVNISDTVLDEKTGIASFVITLDKAATSDVALAWHTQDGTALAGADYAAQTGNLVFRAGETSKTISVLVNDDVTPELAETFHLVVGNAVDGGNAIIGDGVGTARIAASDNAAQALPQIRVLDTMVSEADGYADVVFSLSAPGTQAVSVHYNYRDGSASSYSDFPPFSGTISFAAGETTKTVRVPLYEDTKVESTESLLIQLDTPVNATLGNTSASISMVDNDSGGHFYHYGMGNDVYNIVNGDVVFELADGGTDLVRFGMADYVLPAAVENAEGNALANHISGNELANRLSGLGGNDAIDGGSGMDTAVYVGNRANFTISATTGGFTVTDKAGAEGVDTLANVERIQFADATVALDISGAAGQAYRIYQAAFNRTPDAAGLGYWISVMDSGAPLKEVANGFVGSGEFKALYGNNPANGDIVNKFYENVLHRAPDAGGYNFWLGILDRHDLSSAEVLAQFSESPENQAALATVIGNGIAYTPFG